MTRIIDSHVHLYDPRRGRGLPWPETDTLLYRPMLPHHVRAVAAPLGVSACVAIEVSPWPEDNDWLLDLARDDPFVAGVVGNLAVGTPGFGARLAQYAPDPRFCGVRAGTVWCALDAGKPHLIADLKELAAADLALDAVTMGGGGRPLVTTLLALVARVPELRIVIDHLPFAVPPPTERAAYDRDLRELAGHPRIFAKISNLLPRSGPVPSDPAAYEPVIDQLLELFGPDRVMYGSNWPVSGRVAPYDRALGVLIDTFTRRGEALFEKFFEKNVQKAYRLERSAL